MQTIHPFQAGYPESPLSRTGIAAAAGSSGHDHRQHSFSTPFFSPTRADWRAADRAHLSARHYLGSLLVLGLALCLALAGCGGGYPGLGFSGLSASQAVLDAGQSISLTAAGAGTLPIIWSVSGPGCTGAGCGAASGTNGLHATYTAPPSLSAPIQVTVTATIAGTRDSSTTTITVNPDPSVSGALPAGTVGVAYSATLHGSGGTGVLTLAVAAASLPAGLTFNAATGVISGTPTVAGTSNSAAQVTDSAPTPVTVKAPESITVVAAGSALQLLGGNPPSGVVGTAYTTALVAAGGTAPYTFSLVSGSLPAGLALSHTGVLGVISGTPTAAGTSTFTAQVQDATGAKATGSFSITITTGSSSLSITVGSLPNGMVGVPYTSTIGVAGGTAPYTCSVIAGALPIGLTLGAGCVVSGTPAAAGTANLTVKATDSSNPVLTTTGPVSLTISPAGLSLSTGTLPAGTVGTPYSSAIGVTGGTSPYSCIIASGALPTGLSLGANCLVSGTPTIAGTVTVQVKATDFANPANTTTGPVTITIQPPPPLTFTGSLPNAILNQPYTQKLAASGGVGPYTYAVTAGALPAGLSLAVTTGVISGTPTAPGASTFTITATDSESTPQTAPLPLTLLVVYATTPNDSLLQGPYAFLVQGSDTTVAGVLAYGNATVGSFTANGSGVLTTGELDTNHQGSIITGSTVPTNTLMGTYTIGADDRGTMVISTFNADGTFARTTTYTIAVKAPVSPATTSARGSLTQSNDSLLAGSRGIGTFLQQTATAFATGLTGSYAFGLEGDTPCLPACTANLQAGPVATVGEMAVANGAVTGETDTNLSQLNYPTAILSGTSGSADSNGRVQLSLTNPNIPSAAYPSDFAIYMVNANQAFVMSTDKHSAFILLAGSATSQTSAPFSNASLSGPYVGYENAPTNPGLAGVALSAVANLSTATIFQGSANSTGTCTTNYVEQGGTTALVNGLTGQGSGSNVLNALLGTYESTGNSGCTVGANGRAVLNYPVPSNVLTGVLTLLGLSSNPPAPRVAYLSSTNTGYFLETGYAGLGNLNLQTGKPFSLATLNGTYVYGNTPAVTAATLNASGEFTANGQGQANYIFDESILAGNLNVVTLGVTGTATYVVTDTNNGRFTFGSDVLFAISPTSFVSVDESATNTSPSVALIQ